MTTHAGRRFTLGMVVGIAVAGAACGEGTGVAGGPPGPGPDAGLAADADVSGPPDAPGALGPRVIDRFPEPYALEVARDVVVRATFSDDMAPASLGPATVRLMCDGERIPGTIGYDAATRTVSFTPAYQLPLLATCGASIATGATGAAGVPLAGPAAWAFVVRDGAWTPAQAVGGPSDADEVIGPRAGVDGAGRVQIAWIQQGAVWARRFVPGQGWSAAEVIGVVADARAAQLAVAVDPRGDAVVAWITAGAGGGALWTRRFDATAGWRAPEPVPGAAARYLYSPDVALDAAGDVLVVWTRYDAGATASQVWTARGTAAGGWSAPVRLDAGAGSAYLPHVGTDRGGAAIAQWSQDDAAGTPDVWASRFRPASGWGAPVRLDADATRTDFAQLAVGPGGDAMVVWDSQDGDARRVRVNRFDPAGGWSGPRSLDDPDGYALAADVAIDATGAAIAVWHALPGAAPAELHARRFTPARGWGPVERVHADAGQNAFPKVALSPRGDATVVWGRVDAQTATAWTRRFVRDAGWGEAHPLEPSTGSVWSQLQVATGPGGDAVAVWIRDVEPPHNHPVPQEAWAAILR